MTQLHLIGTYPPAQDPDGWEDMSVNEQKKWIAEHYPQRARELKAQRAALEQSRQRINELESRLSPEAKAQWDEMCGRTKADPMRDCITHIFQTQQELDALRSERAEMERNKTRLRENDLVFRKEHPHTVFVSSTQQMCYLDEDINDLEFEIEMFEDTLKNLKDEHLVRQFEREQNAVIRGLLLLYKFTADESVRKKIDSKIEVLEKEWKKWQEGWVKREIWTGKDFTKRKTIKSPASFADIAAQIGRNISAYAEILLQLEDAVPVNTANLASQKEIKELKSRCDTMKQQAALAIDCARAEGVEIGKKLKWQEIRRARAKYNRSHGAEIK